MEKSIAATEANRQFSRIMRDVQDGVSFVVTARGLPIARIVPANEVNEKRRAAQAELMHRLATQPAQNIPPWTRQELYDDDDDVS